jgi:hypothetical protein
MQHIKKFIFSFILPVILLLLFCSNTGCASQIEERQVNSNSGKVSPPPPSKSLPPGTARIKGQLIKMNKQENHIDCLVKVERVLQYGSSVKPIGSGTQLILAISGEQIDLINILAEGTLKKKYEFIIEQEEVISNSSRQLQWKALGIFDIQSDD